MPDELQDSFLMITEKDSHFEAARKLLLKRRSLLLKQQQQAKPEEELLAQRKKLEKEFKRASNYVDEKVAYTEKLHKSVEAYLKFLNEEMQSFRLQDSFTESSLEESSLPFAGRCCWR